MLFHTPTFFVFGLSLGLRVVAAFFRRLFFGVLLIPPGHPGADLFPPNIYAINEDDADLALITNAFAALGFRLPVIGQGREAGFGFLPEVQLFLWRIDAGQADFVGLIGTIEKR